MQVREIVIHDFAGQVDRYAKLFVADEYPITVDELEALGVVAVEKVLKLINYSADKVDDEVAGVLHQRIMQEKNSDILIIAKDFYDMLINTGNIEQVAERLIEYMLKRQQIISEYEDEIAASCKQGNLEFGIYQRLLNHIPLTELNDHVLGHIDELDGASGLSEEVCQLIGRRGFHRAYLVYMANISCNRIVLELDDVVEVLDMEGLDIYQNHEAEFLKLRHWLTVKYKDAVTVIYDMFIHPYPIIREQELREITDLRIAISLIDIEQLTADNSSTVIEYFNRRYRPTKEVMAILEFFTEVEEFLARTMFYELDMKKVKFAGMSEKNRRKAIELLTNMLELTDTANIIQFMEYVGILDGVLEREIAADIGDDGDEELRKQYCKVINKMPKVTTETIRNIISWGSIYKYSEVIDQELFTRKRYTTYVCSHVGKANEFIIEHERIDVLWPVYVKIARCAKDYAWTRKIMFRNEGFLKLLQERKEYENMPEENRMAMSVIPQDAGSLQNVLTYGESFVLDYYTRMNGFQSKEAAEQFLVIMEEHTNYAQNQAIYEHVHPKLIDAVMKRRYTKLYRMVSE